jgi:hypothetical protein
MTGNKWTRRALLSAIAGLGLTLALATCAAPRPKLAIGAWGSFDPPAGLKPGDVPQFIYFTSDDNGLSGLPGSGGGGGLHWLTELFSEYRNPAGAGQTQTFDGAPLRYTFFVNTFYLDPERGSGWAERRWPVDEPVYVQRAWTEAVEAGHETALHTHSHPHGSGFSVGQWREEIGRNIDFLTRPRPAEGTSGRPVPGSGLGLRREDLVGFRAPFLEYNDNALTAVSLEGLTYDSSLEEASRRTPAGVGFIWPYLLDRGRPGSAPSVGPHPGLWEIPVYEFLIPPDEECRRYGLPPGLRDRLKSVRDYFIPADGEITGMDWNLWLEFRLCLDEFLAALEYTLDRHLEFNRCPMIVGLHSDLYSDKVAAANGGTSPAERREAVRTFLEYALSKPEVRLVSCRELLDWCRHPAPLRRLSGPDFSRRP